RGHGQSRAPAGKWTMADFAGDLAALLAQRHITRAHLIGATLGGVTILEYALAHPEMVQSLVLISTAPDTTDEMRVRFEASAAVVESGDLAGFAEGYINFIFSPAFVAQHAAQVADFQQRLERIDATGYAQSIRALGNRPDLSPRMGRLSIPALIVTGAVDPIPTSAPGAALLERSLPKAHATVVADAAHLPHIEQPEMFNRTVLDFLAAVERDTVRPAAIPVT
ncbi:MAG: alpha/beta fold hydrolase, partial [Candidatus Rokubacteria bacterium]|nr:alpha/beta fold hydrolase [Candidatus Rokubacteria bacterium]